MQLAIVQTAAELIRCFPVMHLLRPHLTQEQFVQQVQRQQIQGYQLLAAAEEGEIKALAGFRLGEDLASGKFLYVDDLVTREGDRAQGYGAALLNWLIAYAKTEGCQELCLDSGVQRFAAHRFYFRQRLEIRSYHFAIAL